eukprot:706347-Rhodomonas_salina.2
MCIRDSSGTLHRAPQSVPHCTACAAKRAATDHAMRSISCTVSVRSTASSGTCRASTRALIPSARLGMRHVMWMRGGGAGADIGDDEELEDAGGAEAAALPPHPVSAPAPPATALVGGEGVGPGGGW